MTRTPEQVHCATPGCHEMTDERDPGEDLCEWCAEWAAAVRDDLDEMTAAEAAEGD